MIESAILDLIEKELDGTASPEEKTRLAAYLATHAEARAYYEEALQLSVVLSSMEPVPPPPELKTDVLRAIRGRSRQRRGGSVTSSLLPGFLRQRSAFHLCGAFACGAVVGILAMALVGGRAPSRSSFDRVPGTMIPEIAWDQLEEVDRLPFSFEGVEGTAVTRAHAGLVVADISLTTEEEVLLTVEAGDGSLVPSSFTTMDGTPTQVNMEQNAARIVQTGIGAYRMAFALESGQCHTLNIHVSGGGKEFEGSIAACSP